MYCTIRIIFYYILIICCFLLKVSFLYHCWYCMGGRERVGAYLCKTEGWVYVSMWYFFFPPPTCALYLLPRCRCYAQFFVTKRVHIVHYLGPVQMCFFFFFFFCKTKTCNIITKLLSFSLPKSELLKTLKSNKKKKKSEMLNLLFSKVC